MQTHPVIFVSQRILLGQASTPSCRSSSSIRASSASSVRKRRTYASKSAFSAAGAEIADVFHCPSVDDGHPDRKPNPGLFLKAAAAHGLDMAACVSVGDRERDIRAALAAGVGRNFLFSAEDVPTLATARVEALEEVAAWL